SKIQWDDNETRIVSVSAPEAEHGMVREEASLPPGMPEMRPKVLIVDDDREAVEICRMVLGSAFDIVVAETGESGLRMAFTEKPSLVLLDLYLPGLDGIHVCRILRTQEETRDLPIAFFSAGTQTDEMEECFASGADDFIVKPFSGKELLDKIWRLLMKKKEESYR
ncbi:MAG: response regulator, partial [Chitinivibrionales bacterium]|nr:response regulator [Chitinivibrionales bacterium]MBD3394574.1 response regulator [Chitinivibrionales bacterium]